MQRILTTDGLFAAGNPSTGVPGTIVTSNWLNDVQEEISEAIEGAGIALDGAKRNQLYLAIKAIIASSVTGPVIVPTTPITNVGDLIFVKDRQHWAMWVSTAFYTGYRSLYVGDWYIGSMSEVRPMEIEGKGGTFNLAEYPSLWAWAQERNYVVPAASWVPHETMYAQIGTDKFRVPDYRDMFPRVEGTDADTANPRDIGSYQSDAVGPFAINVHASSIAAPGSGVIALNLAAGALGNYIAPITKSETRGASTAVSTVILI